MIVNSEVARKEKKQLKRRSDFASERRFNLAANSYFFLKELR